VLVPGVVVEELPLPVGDATPDDGGGAAAEDAGVDGDEADGDEAAPPDDDGIDGAELLDTATGDDVGAAAELLEATLELLGAALAELRLAHCEAAASGTVSATVMPQAPMTQVVAADSIFETLSGSH